MTHEDFLKIVASVVDSYDVRIPTYVLVSKTNKKAVNLNIYRNLHHHHANTQKKNFTDDVTPLLRNKPRAEKIWIHYTIFAPRNGRLDTMNVGSIADKYFSDTMVEAGKIPDDNQEHIVLSTFSFGGVCPMDGHAIATVNILKEEPTDMRILLDQEDIQAALNAYVKTLSIPNAEDATVELEVSEDGIEAEVVIGKAPVKNKGGRPRKKPGPKPASTKVEVADDPETDSEGGSDSTDSGSSDGPEVEAETGTEENAEPVVKKESSKGNLFGDDEASPSSDSAETEESKTSTTSKVKSPKKSSIFDVD